MLFGEGMQCIFKPATKCDMDEILTLFIAEHPEISDDDVDLLEKFVGYALERGATNTLAAQDKIDGLNAATEQLRLLVSAVTATRVAPAVKMTKKGLVEDIEGPPVEEAWMNKGESEQLKRLFFRTIDSLYDTKIASLQPHGN